MPVTRSSSRHPHPHPFPTASPPPSQPPNATTTDVVVLLPSNRDSQTTSKRKKDKQRSRIRHPIVEQDVIEISSDDESPPVKPRSTAVQATLPLVVPPLEPAAIADLRRQIRRYREEAAKSKKDLEKISKEAVELREENMELQTLRNPGDGKVTIDKSHLNDQLECEICTSRMWIPYVLPDCGHTFCQGCLQDWFSATQAQFMTHNPGYNPNNPISNQNVAGLYNLAQAMMTNPHTTNSPQAAALIAQLLPSHPQYTCPTCRETVTSRPIEVFALKALFRTIATGMGESSPKRTKQADQAPAGPWDGFFPRKNA